MSQQIPFPNHSSQTPPLNLNTEQQQRYDTLQSQYQKLTHDLEQLKLQSMAQFHNHEFVVQVRDQLIIENRNMRADLERVCRGGQELDQRHSELRRRFNVVSQEKYASFENLNSMKLQYDSVIKEKNTLEEKVRGLDQQLNSLTGELENERQCKIELEEHVSNAMSEIKNLSDNLTARKVNLDQIKSEKSTLEKLVSELRANLEKAVADGKEHKEQVYQTTKSLKEYEQKNIGEIGKLRGDLERVENEKNDLKGVHERTINEQKKHYATNTKEHAKAIANLNAKIGKLEDAEKAYSLKENEFKRKMKVLEDKRKQHHVQVEEAKRLQSTLELRELDISILKKSKEKSENAVKAREEKIEELGKQKETEVASLKKLIDEKNAALKERDEKLANLAKEIQANGDKVLQQGGVILKQSEKIAQLNKKLADSNDENRAKLEQVRQQSKTINSHADRMTNIQKQLDIACEGITSKEKIIRDLQADKDHKFTVLKELFKQATEQVNTHLASLKKRDEQIVTVNKQNAKKSLQINTLFNQLAETKIELLKVQQEKKKMGEEKDAKIIELKTSKTSLDVAKQQMVAQVAERKRIENLCECEKREFSKQKLELSGYKAKNAELQDLLKTKEEELKQNNAEIAVFKEKDHHNHHVFQSQQDLMIKNQIEQEEPKAQLKRKSANVREVREKFENLQNGIIRRDREVAEQQEQICNLVMEAAALRAIKKRALLSADTSERPSGRQQQSKKFHTIVSNPPGVSPAKFNTGLLPMSGSKASRKRKTAPSSPNELQKSSTSSDFVLIDLTLSDNDDNEYDDNDVADMMGCAPPASKTSRKVQVKQKSLGTAD